MTGITVNEKDNLLLDAVLIDVINSQEVCSLLNMVLLEATNDVGPAELAMVNVIELDVIRVLEVSSELYDSSTELIDVLIDVSKVTVVCTS